LCIGFARVHVRDVTHIAILPVTILEIIKRTRIATYLNAGQASQHGKNAR
jgi:hypothetical protein